MVSQIAACSSMFWSAVSRLSNGTGSSMTTGARSFSYCCFSLVSSNSLPVSLTPAEIPSSSTLLNVLRNLGGAFGIAIIATLIDNDTRTHVSQIGSTLAATSIEGQAYLMQLAQTMMAQGAGPEQAQLQARAMLSNTISREAAIMAYNQVFYVMGIFLLVASALMLLLKQPAPRAPDAEPVEA